jgi:hypothetical protein
MELRIVDMASQQIQRVVLSVNHPVWVLVLLLVGSEIHQILKLVVQAKLLVKLPHRVRHGLTQPYVTGTAAIESSRKDVLAGGSVLQQDLHSRGAWTSDPAVKRAVPEPLHVDVAAPCTLAGRVAILGPDLQ